MFFCGTCVAGYKHSADNTYVITDDANSLIIESGVFDHLYVTRSVEDQEEDFPSWDYDTIMSADLDGNLRGGNISYMIQQINSIRIKRRRTGSYNWVTLFDVPVHEAKDLEFERYDRYAANGVGYEYALVPVVDNKEGYVNKNGITPHFAKGDAPVTTTLTGVVHAPTYDAETRTIKMPVFGGDELTINLGKDMVVKSGAYNTATKEIQLTISTGEVVKIPAAALVDVYTGGASKTASVTVSDQNVISVDVKVSAAENNNIEIKEDGLYVANPDAYTKAQTDEKIKAANDALSGHSGDKVAHITAEERTAWNAKATTENVATAKSEAISAAATDAQKKADAALGSAKKYAAGLNTAMDTRVKAVEGQLTWQTIAAKA